LKTYRHGARGGSRRASPRGKVRQRTDNRLRRAYAPRRKDGAGCPGASEGPDAGADLT